MRAIALLATILLLAACNREPDIFFDDPRVDLTEPRRVVYPSIEVREISLPAYADASEIVVDAGGALISTETFWADDPARAVTLDVARHLSQITHSRVAPDPWPFDDPPTAELDIRVETLLARADGAFVLEAQWFAAGQDGWSDRSGRVDLVTPYDPAGGPPAVAAARSTAIAGLAAEIAEALHPR